MLSIESAVMFLRWINVASNSFVWYLGNMMFKSHDHSLWIVSRSESVVAEFGVIIWDLRSTWHPSGTVIVADFLIVTD
jgi:hypothetical protein